MTLPAWVPAAERKPAPEPLLLVQSFVNTAELDLGTDLLADPGQATAWLRQCGLLGPQETAGAVDLSMAREVREGIRAMLAYHSGGPAPSAADLRPLEAVAGRSQLWLTFGPAGRVQLDPRPHGELAGGLAGLLLIIRDAQQDGTWARLKSCPGHLCGWAFYDRSASGQSRWCSMQLCGSRAKMRAYRGRLAQ